MTLDLSHDLRSALSSLVSAFPLRAGALNLLKVLGYSSKRTIDTGSVEEFLELFANNSRFTLTDRQLKLFESWTSVDILFQFTNAEISVQSNMFEKVDFDEGRIESFLFLAVDMAEDSWTRSHLADTARTVNRFFAMPVILLFRYGTNLTLAAVHRRAHRHDDTRDVLEKVTLIKDIRVKEPHRAHIEILSELATSRMSERGVASFDDLHAKWEESLDVEVLNKRFYLELFAWFERAVEECHFPDDGAGKGSSERNVIRLITRLLFIWFLKEKGLVPEELFEEEFACSSLKNHAPKRTDYYCAVLQNLFFATLNTEIDKRRFNDQEKPEQTDVDQYRYQHLIVNPEAFVDMLKQVPFVNGGLFDCLDDFVGQGTDGKLIDAYYDNSIQDKNLVVPARLFLGDEGLFAIFRRYKFTIEEGTPLDREVALDPELLGLTFENLLAAYNPETKETVRNTTGSYYTPRSVVDYMVREALTEALTETSRPVDGDISFWRDRLKYLFDHSDAMDDADELFEESDKRTIVSAIAGIRTLDPAVGSGAFPMGILQTLTLALRRLDPDNTLWEEIQLERAKAQAGSAFESLDQESRDEALYEISSTFEKYRDSDFGRKLCLIQNCIYGVDIQPIACQIAKLRYFISLVIEQTPDPNSPNFGIKPLPNLETRLVAADSLIDFKSDIRKLPFDDKVLSMQRKIEDIRKRYFLADSRSKKLKCMRVEKKLRNEFQETLKKERDIWIEIQRRDIERSANSLPNSADRKLFRDSKLRSLSSHQRNFDNALEKAYRIADWDPYNQNTYARWFSAEYMFGISDGFDVVIGNPPYIQLQKNRGEVGKRYRFIGFKTFESTGDIYQLFYERGCGLLKQRTGVLAYITSNSWLKARYGKTLRKWFAEHHTPIQLIEMGKDVFKNAIVDTAVLFVRHGTDQRVTCPAVDVDQASDNRFPPQKMEWGTLQPKGDSPWMTLSPVERTVMEKMEAVGTPLKEWDISIYRGVVTGYNKAFIVDTKIRDRLISEDPASEEILKPMLRGRDIARYRANWAGLWLISTFPSLNVNINKYPAIKRHLLSFGKERLAQDGCQLIGGGRSRKKTPHSWYELQDTCAYQAEFGKYKVFWMHMTPYGRFALGEPNITCNQKCFMVTGKDLEYLCAILNSTLVTWLVGRIAVTTGMGLPQWDKYTVESVPIVHPNQPIMDSIQELVNSILTEIDTENTEAVNDFENTIDRAVFNLYGLTSHEVSTLKRKITSRF